MFLPLTISPYSPFSCCSASSSGASVSWVGSSVNCTLPPPTFFGAYIVTPESQPVNAAIGSPLIATASSPTSQVLFSIIGGNANNAFWLNACSGQLKVLNATLNYLVQPVYYLTVQVRRIIQSDFCLLPHLSSPPTCFM